MSRGASVTITDLPIPPSANRIWRVANGRQHKSAEYTAWLTECGWRTAKHRNAFPGPYALAIEADRSRPYMVARDIDNLIKPVNDMLQHAGVVANDKHCMSVTARWASPMDWPMRITVSVA